MTQTAQILEGTRQIDGVPAPAVGTWNIDGSHSTVSFVARHMMVTKVRGTFDRFDGQIVVAERPEDSSVDVTIDAASFNSNSEQRDAHVKSGDFLDVETYPTLKFRSTAVRRTGETSLDVVGDLTIRDVTRPVTLKVDYEGAQRTPWGGTVAGFTATTEIDREEFGITWNQTLETGGVLVGKKVKIELEIEAVPAQ